MLGQIEVHQSTAYRVPDRFWIPLTIWTPLPTRCASRMAGRPSVYGMGPEPVRITRTNLKEKVLDFVQWGGPGHTELSLSQKDICRQVRSETRI